MQIKNNTEKTVASGSGVGDPAVCTLCSKQVPSCSLARYWRTHRTSWIQLHPQPELQISLTCSCQEETHWIKALTLQPWPQRHGYYCVSLQLAAITSYSDLCSCLSLQHSMKRLTVPLRENNQLQRKMAPVPFTFCLASKLQWGEGKGHKRRSELHLHKLMRQERHHKINKIATRTLEKDQKLLR